ncbi:hypothetical protein C4D60_Mb05t03080 [Musa balbisiana]|uniref:Uncharacterized protein n=1 Tax=Musa balbisiana TaxID=52838 RepID=A0A4V4H7W1_MUSBA|nr:hypothetical protein C4D60_Mb05t03080 [Musa balbisiana]
MEKERNRREEIKTLLLKLAIPLSLPLAGFTFSIIAKKSRTSSKSPSSTSSQVDQLMDSSPCISLSEFEDEVSLQGQESSSMYLQEEEEEEEEEIMRVQCPENPCEVSIINFQDAHSLEEEVESLKCLVDSINGRSCEVESQFWDYCDAKEQESQLQKLKLECLGLKLECLEAQNQRLEATISKQQGALESLESMRTELKCLRRKAKKLSKLNRLHLHEARRQALILDARDAELSKINEELKGVKDIANQLLKGKKVLDSRMDSFMANYQSASESKEETLQDDSIRILSNNEMLDRLDQFQYRWYLEMEELIYLGWVGSCLRNELEVKPVQEMGGQWIMELPANDQVTSCWVELHDTDRSSPVAGIGLEACSVATARKNHSCPEKPTYCSSSVTELGHEAYLDVAARKNHPGLMNQEEEEHEVKPVQKIGGQWIMELPANDNVMSCRVELHDSDCSPVAGVGHETCSVIAANKNHSGSKKPIYCSSSVAELGIESCFDVAARKNHSDLKKPKLLYKLKGWARGKGKPKQFRD